jgi:hypothetical protein
MLAKQLARGLFGIGIVLFLYLDYKILYYFLRIAFIPDHPLQETSFLQKLGLKFENLNTNPSNTEDIGSDPESNSTLQITKMIVMGKLKSENITWVTEELPEWVV